MFSGEATNTNFIVLGLARSGLKLRSIALEVCTLNHYTTDADFFLTKIIFGFYVVHVLCVCVCVVFFFLLIIVFLLIVPFITIYSVTSNALNFD